MVLFSQPYVRIVSSLLAANEIWESKEQVGRNRSARYFHRSFSRTQVGQHRANLKAALCQTRGESKTTAASVIDECIPTESKPSSKSKSVSRDKNATTQTLEREQKVLNYIQSEQVVEKQLLAQVRQRKMCRWPCCPLDFFAALQGVPRT